ncbi:hypothetical protein VTN00DRAFT_8988 [Thermoascus crustaceus]|uniref:uncharacterized protein n=1 Tax=Thermoascus crustaceus TaxID=5088 RepID=UPI0037422EBC
MRFTASSLLVLTLGGSTLASAASFIPSLTCLKVKDIVEGIDTTPYMEKAINRVCGAGCQPKVTDYEAMRRLAIPYIQSEADRMGTSNLVPYYVNLMDAAYKLSVNKCGLDKLPGGDLCSSPEQLQSFAKCLQSNGWRLLLANLGDILPLLSAESCQKELEYASNLDPIEEAAFAFLDQYVQEEC